MTRVLTLMDSGELDFRTIDRILQSVVFFADAVAVRASYRVSAHDRAVSKKIDRRLDELREQKLISLWAHEYEVDDRGQVRAEFASPQNRRHADLVVGAAGLRERLTEMNEMLRVGREEAYRRHPERPLRQGVAEIVSLRNHLSSLVISSELRQEGLLANPVAGTVFRRGAPSGRVNFREAVAREVIAQLRLGPLTRLTADEIAKARRYNAGFRRLLDDSLIAVSQGMNPVITPEAAATEIVTRYRQITNRLSRRSEAGRTTTDITFDVLGMALPPSILVKYLLTAFSWRRGVSATRPYLMLMHLEQGLAEQSADQPGAR